MAVVKKCRRNRLLLPSLGALIALVAVGNLRLEQLQPNVQPPRIIVNGTAVKEDKGAVEWYDEAQSKQRFLQVKAVLEDLQHRKALTTKFSNRQEVLEQGYPLQWTPCILERILRSKDGTRDSKDGTKESSNLLRVTLIGGSMAARAGEKCSSTNHPLDGRYSNLLQERFGSKAPFQIEVTNVAQGATTSVLSAVLLDTLIVPDATDIIIWDHAPNDSYKWEEMNRGGTQEEIRKLDFWLTRVRLLFAQAGKPPPPILMLHWWPPEWFKKDKKGLVDLSTRTLDHMGPLLQSYRDAGWEIAVVDVGAPISLTPFLRKDHRLLHDDPVHPSCTMNQYVADMLQHALYMNWPTTGSMNQCSRAMMIDTDKATTSASWPPHKTIAWYDKDLALWADLFSDQAVIGSLSSWEPKQRFTSLHIANIHEIASSWPTLTWEKTDDLRADRKNGFVIPACSTGNKTLHLVEPNLKWMGVSLLRGNKLFINGLLVDVPVREPNVEPFAWPHHHLQRWVHLPDHVPKSDRYEVSMCCNWKKGTSFFHFLIGVSMMMPEQ